MVELGNLLFGMGENQELQLNLLQTAKKTRPGSRFLFPDSIPPHQFIATLKDSCLYARGLNFFWFLK